MSETQKKMTLDVILYKKILIFSASFCLIVRLFCTQEGSVVPEGIGVVSYVSHASVCFCFPQFAAVYRPQRGF